MIKWYNYHKDNNCIKYRSLYALLVGCPLNQECGDMGMAYGWYVRVYFTERDHFWSTLLSRITLMGYGYMYPSDLRLSWWLASNSLCFDAGLSKFLIRWWKIFGYNQVLVKSECESRWDWPLQVKLKMMYHYVSIQQNFGQSSPSEESQYFWGWDTMWTTLSRLTV